MSKTSPFNIEAEESLLGVLLTDSNVFPKISSLIKHTDFYEYRYSDIFRMLSEMNEQNIPVDAITLASELQKKNLLEKIGGSSMITFLLSKPPSIANFLEYVNIIVETSRQRKMIQLAKDLELVASETISTDAKEWLETKLNSDEIQEMFKEQGKTKFTRINSKTSYDKYSSRKTSADVGFKTNYQKLDSYMALKGGDLIIVAGRPGMGKSFFAQELVFKTKCKALYFSFEMGEDEIYDRVVSRNQKVESGLLDFFKKSVMTPEQMDALDKVFSMAERIKELPDIFFEYEDCNRMEMVVKKIREYKKKQKIDIVVIDHLKLIKTKQKDPRLAMSEITRELKELAMSLGITIIALSQLNRESEKRPDKRPQLSDLIESGDIEANADKVLGIFRPHYYIKDKESLNALASFNIMEVIILKNRKGGSGIVEMFCDPRYYLVEDFLMSLAGYWVGEVYKEGYYTETEYKEIEGLLNVYQSNKNKQ